MDSYTPPTSALVQHGFIIPDLVPPLVQSPTKIAKLSALVQDLPLDSTVPALQKPEGAPSRAERMQH